jgi:hypothetical protein
MMVAAEIFLEVCDVREKKPPHTDIMESFGFAETFK